MPIRSHYPRSRGIPVRSGIDPAAASAAERSNTLFDVPRIDQASTLPYLDRLAGHHMPVDSNDVKGLDIEYITARQKFVVTRDGGPPPSISSWRSTVVQPCAIPDMLHTGVRSSFVFQGPTYLRPDGSISAELRNGIQKKFMETPSYPVVDIQDMRRVDVERSLRRSIALQKNAAFVLRHGGGASSRKRGEGAGGAAITSSEGADTEHRELLIDGLGSLNSAGSTVGSSDGSRANDIAFPRKHGRGLQSDEASVGTRSQLSPLDRIGHSEPSKTFGGRTRTKRMRGKAGNERRLKKPFSSSSLLGCLLDLEYGNTDVKRVMAGDNAFEWDIGGYIDYIDHRDE